MKLDLHQQITDRILAELEKGTVPWVRPWTTVPGENIPANAVTNRPYSGGNVIMLWIAREIKGWPMQRYLTFNQAKAAGGTVRKGEKGTHIYFWKRSTYTKTNEAGEDEEKKSLLIRGYTVFNVAQCDGLPEKIVNGKPGPAVSLNPEQRDALADEFVKGTEAKVFHVAGDRACFIPSADVIHMPKYEHFKTANHYYNTVFHELTHWTGHKTRLDRFFKAGTPRQEYAAEELVAEIGAAFLAAEFNYDGVTNNAAYIATWIKLLKEDKKAFYSAATKAQKAVDYLRGLALKDAKPSEAPEAETEEGE